MQDIFVRKILTANDLGITGGHQAGIAIPKNPDVLSFFPKLDIDLYNPDCMMGFKVPEFNEYVTLRFVYYNNKLHGQGTRNEYRLTGTTSLFRRLNANVGDEIEFQKDSSGEVSVRLIRTKRVERQPGTVILSNGWSFDFD